MEAIPYYALIGFIYVIWLDPTVVDYIIQHSFFSGAASDRDHIIWLTDVLTHYFV